jgi:hypothetical protein
MVAQKPAIGSPPPSSRRASTVVATRTGESTWPVINANSPICRGKLTGAHIAPGVYRATRKLFWLAWRVRDVSRLGTRPGQASAVRSNRSENNRRLRVRSQGQLCRKSSKRVQCGEPTEIGVSNLYFTGDPNSTLELVVSQRLPLIAQHYATRQDLSRPEGVSRQLPDGRHRDIIAPTRFQLRCYWQLVR